MHVFIFKSSIHLDVHVGIENKEFVIFVSMKRLALIKVDIDKDLIMNTKLIASKRSSTRSQLIYHGTAITNHILQ